VVYDSFTPTGQPTSQPSSRPRHLLAPRQASQHPAPPSVRPTGRPTSGPRGRPSERARLSAVHAARLAGHLSVPRAVHPLVRRDTGRARRQLRACRTTLGTTVKWLPSSQPSSDLYNPAVDQTGRPYGRPPACIIAKIDQPARPTVFLTLWAATGAPTANACGTAIGTAVRPSVFTAKGAQPASPRGQPTSQSGQ
jgi:hypothetical protein